MDSWQLFQPSYAYCITDQQREMSGYQATLAVSFSLTVYDFLILVISAIAYHLSYMYLSL